MEIFDYKRRVAFVMPGQGKYNLDLVRELYYGNRRIKEIFHNKQNRQIVDNILKQNVDNISNEELQPVIYISNVIISTALIVNGIVPNALAGFSAGEISALAIGGAFSIDDGLKLIISRAKLMQSDIEKKESMMAVIFNINKVVLEIICRKIEEVFIANINSPNQIVISLAKERYSEVKRLVLLEGGKIYPLALEGGFHSNFVKEAAKKFYKYLKKIDVVNPIIDTYSNFTGNRYGNEIKILMSKQIDNRVDWNREIIRMKEEGINCFIETSIYGVLSELIGEIIPGIETMNLKSLDNLLNIKLS